MCLQPATPRSQTLLSPPLPEIFHVSFQTILLPPRLCYLTSWFSLFIRHKGFSLRLSSLRQDMAICKVFCFCTLKYSKLNIFSFFLQPCSSNKKLNKSSIQKKKNSNLNILCWIVFTETHHFQMLVTFINSSLHTFTSDTVYGLNIRC